MGYPLPPELQARFAAANQLPELAAAMAHDPKRMRWWNLGLLVIILGGAAAGVWAMALTSAEFEDRRRAGVGMSVAVTVVLAFGWWVGYRDWKVRSAGAVRRVLAIIGEMSMTRTGRLRFGRVTLLLPSGETEQLSTEPYNHRYFSSGALGVVYFRGPIPVEFRRLAA